MVVFGRFPSVRFGVKIGIFLHVSKYGKGGQGFRVAADSVLIQNLDDHFDLLFRMHVRCDSCDADIVDFVQAHVEILGDVVVGAARDESEFVVFVVNGHGIRVEGIVCLADKVQFGSNLQVLERLAAIPIAESGDVEIVKVDLLDGLVFSCFHKAIVFKNYTYRFIFESKNKARLYQNVGQCCIKYNTPAIMRG